EAGGVLQGDDARGKDLGADEAEVVGGRAGESDAAGGAEGEAAGDAEVRAAGEDDVAVEGDGVQDALRARAGPELSGRDVPRPAEDRTAVERDRAGDGGGGRDREGAARNRERLGEDKAADGPVAGRERDGRRRRDVDHDVVGGAGEGVAAPVERVFPRRAVAAAVPEDQRQVRPAFQRFECGGLVGPVRADPPPKHDPSWVVNRRIYRQKGGERLTRSGAAAVAE